MKDYTTELNVQQDITHCVDIRFSVRFQRLNTITKNLNIVAVLAAVVVLLHLSAVSHPPTHPRDCIRDHRRLQGGVGVVGWGRRCSLQGLVDLRKHRLIPIRLTPEHAQ